MNEVVSLAEGSRRIGLPPRAISDGIFRGLLNPAEWHQVGGRYFVPVSALPGIKATLRKHSRKGKREAVAGTMA